MLWPQCPSRAAAPSSKGPFNFRCQRKEAMTKDQPERSWIVPVTVAEIPDGGSHYDLSADASAREGIAKVASLRSLPRLEASFDLSRRGEGVAVRGEIRAQVGQTCVVTLEPIERE